MMKNFENEFSGSPLAAYRAGVELTQEGITKLTSCFVQDGLDPSWSCPAGAGKDGQTLLSRIVQTVVSRNWRDMKEDESFQAFSLFADVFLMFIHRGFKAGARKGLLGTRVLGALLEWERPDYTVILVRAILNAGANPTLPIFPALLGHGASPLDIAEGNLARSYEEKTDLPETASYFVIYRMILAAGDGRDYTQVRPLEMMEDAVLQDVAFLSVKSQDCFYSWGKHDGIYHADFSGFIRLRFDQGDVYVTPWGGAVTDSFVTMPGVKKEESLNDIFGECIGKRIKNTERALSTSENRCLYIGFENGMNMTFLSDAFNPFVSQSKGEIFLYSSDNRIAQEDDYDYDDEDEDDYDEDDDEDMEEIEQDGAPREGADSHAGDVS